jgi:hypothetical protein
MASVVGWLPQLAGADSGLAGCPGSNGSTMLTNEAAADALLPAPVAAGRDEAAGPGELDDPEDPQPASGTARTASATAGASSIVRRPAPITSIRPMDATPSRHPHYSQRS